MLLGGATVQGIFEETAKAVSGHRQLTMLDNYPWYLSLTFVQSFAVAWVAALRLKRVESFRDPFLIGLGILILVNAFAGADWPWWGS